MDQHYATARMYAVLYRARMAMFGRGIGYSVVHHHCVAIAIGWASR